MHNFFSKQKSNLFSHSIGYMLFLTATELIAAPTVIDLLVDLNDAPQKNYCVSSTNQCSQGWSFWQHKSDKHSNYHGHAGYSANDLYAWDINLNTPTWNHDKGKNVYAVADGEIYIGYE